jgi:hypothetical protein
MTDKTTTAEKLIFKSELATVTYDAEKLMGKIVWQGNPKGRDYQIPFEKMLEHAKKYRVRRFLSDIRNQGVVSVDNRKWFEKEMFPQAVRTGLEKAAAINNDSVFKRYYINMIISGINKFGVPLKIFSDEEKAVAFLMEE